MTYYTYTFGERAWDVSAADLLSAFLEAQGTRREVYEFAFLMSACLDFHEGTIPSYIESSGTTQAEALLIFWMMSPEYWLGHIQANREVEGFQQYEFEYFKQLVENYKSGFYAASNIFLDPREVFGQRYTAEEWEMFPEIFRRPLAGISVDIESLTVGFDGEGYPPEAWQPMQILYDIDIYAQQDEYDITSPEFCALVLKAHAASKIRLTPIYLDPEPWLGADPRPLFPEWIQLPKEIWLTLSMVPELFKAAARASLPPTNSVFSA